MSRGVLVFVPALSRSARPQAARGRPAGGPADGLLPAATIAAARAGWWRTGTA